MAGASSSAVAPSTLLARARGDGDVGARSPRCRRCRRPPTSSTLRARWCWWARATARISPRNLAWSRRWRVAASEKPSAGACGLTTASGDSRRWALWWRASTSSRRMRAARPAKVSPWRWAACTAAVWAPSLVDRQHQQAVGQLRLDLGRRRRHQQRHGAVHLVGGGDEAAGVGILAGRRDRQASLRRRAASRRSWRGRRPPPRRSPAPCGRGRRRPGSRGPGRSSPSRRPCCSSGTSDKAASARVDLPGRRGGLDHRRRAAARRVGSRARATAPGRRRTRRRPRGRRRPRRRGRARSGSAEQRQGLVTLGGGHLRRRRRRGRGGRRVAGPPRWPAAPARARPSAAPRRAYSSLAAAAT